VHFIQFILQYVAIKQAQNYNPSFFVFFFLTLKHKHTSGCAGLGGEEVDQTDKQLFKTRGVQGVTDERLERFLFLAMILSTPC